MDDSLDTKPVVGGDEGVAKAEDELAATGDVVADESDSRSANAVEVNDKIETNEEKMDTESSAVDTTAESKPQTTAESEPTVPAVDEGVDDVKGVEPSVEPVPEVALKSPAEVEKALSPAPAVQSSTPPRNQSSKKPKVDLTTVPVRQYLDTTVVPILLQGLSSLARERPAKPINFLANFLMEKASEYDE